VVKLRVVERSLWTAGLLLVGVWAVHHWTGLARARSGVQRVEQQRAAAIPGATSATARPAFAVGPPDLQLWDEKRINLWRAAQANNDSTPLGVLRIGRLRIEVPILEGTSDEILDRGVGHIEDTAVPGATGNSGLAGHRDGFFRALKDVAIGDVLDVETVAGHTEYRVEKTWLVTPDDVWVLDATDKPTVTLVTCYPFYFIGPAPQRFIVRAVAAADGESRTSR